MYLKQTKEKDTNNPHYIPKKKKKKLPLTKKMSYTNSTPKNNYSHIQNYFPFLSWVTKGKSVK